MKRGRSEGKRKMTRKEENERGRGRTEGKRKMTRKEENEGR